MKHLHFLFLLIATVLLFLSTESAMAQRSYVVRKLMTADEVVSELNKNGLDISFNDLRAANPQKIRTQKTKLNAGTSLILPLSNTLYNQTYVIKPGGVVFWDDVSMGFLFYNHMEYNYKSSPKSAWSYGAFVDVKGGGFQLNDGSYNEPAINWQAGARVKLMRGSDYFGFNLGYGQNYLNTQLASSLKTKLFSHYLLGRVEFHAYGDRLLGQTNWFTDGSLYLEGKIPLKEDKLFWTKKPINLELLAEQATLGGELIVFDLPLSKEFILPFGVAGSFNQYNQDDLKFFYKIGLFVEPLRNQRQTGRIYFDYLGGITGIKYQRFSIGLELDFGLFLNKNETKKSLTNRRGR